VTDELREWIAEHNPDALLADGFEDAIVGVAERCGQPTLVVYDVARCLDILMQRHGMTDEAAAEYFSFNTLGAWVGEHTPLYLTRYPPEEPMPSESEKQRRFMGADLARKRAGKKTKTGMSERQLKDFAKKPPAKRSRAAGPTPPPPPR
jgi:hypothetical protein